MTAMSEINLAAGSMRLRNYDRGSDTFTLSVEYSSSVNKAVDVRGVDELYALQYLVNRAVQKLELFGERQRQEQLRREVAGIGLGG